MGKMFQQLAERLLGEDGYDGREWAMSFAERFALTMVLRARRPGVAIEIGSLHGGSLSVIHHYADKVYSIDPNPEVAGKLAADFPRAEFFTAPSDAVLPDLLARLESDGADLGFILVDGDHSEAGVRRDLEAILRYRPAGELFVLMHDSFNPDCRRAMESMPWADSPWVHWVDYDFVPGFWNSVPGWEDQMWCGFALAYLRPEHREGALETDALLARQYERLFPLSIHAQG